MLTETHEAVQGQRQSWNLIKKLGEGDAGEVYLVDSLLDHQLAILKRPRKGSFFSDILRQASQIKTEGSILRGMSRAVLAKKSLRLNIPALVDQNRPEFGVSEQTFIVIEPAKGLDLKLLSQVIRFGSASLIESPTSPEAAFLVEQWAQFHEFPAQLLVSILLDVLILLETIHTTAIHSDQGAQSGVIWNDVKPDHLYWDPFKLRLTVIDWGNSRFLESDGVTKDRQYSAWDDLRQYVQEMGSFVADVNPGLYTRLQWPEGLAGRDSTDQVIQPLKENLSAMQSFFAEELQVMRKQEEDLFQVTRPELEQISQFTRLQQQLAAYGELPDMRSANSFLFKAAYQMANERRFTEFQAVCANAASLPSSPGDKWKLLGEIADVAKQTGDLDAQAQDAFTDALTAGVAGDWTTALWGLFTSLGDGIRPAWWEIISQDMRRVSLGLDPEALSPYTMFARLYFTLRAEVTRKGEARLRGISEENGKNGGEASSFHWQASEELVATVNEEIIKKWKELEPSPPNSGISYTEVDSLIDPIEKIIPGTRQVIERSMLQLKAQVDLVFTAWEQKDFELARRGLRSILVWDPDRLRLLTAERAIEAAPRWLARVRKGASTDEPFYDYLTSVELEGRTIRNRVGPAKWLDDTLEAYKRLRKGSRSVDLMIEFPEVLTELPWLKEYQAREILTLPHTHPLTLERDPEPENRGSIPQGINESKFGRGEGMELADPLDTWLPEARGSSARVFAGILRNPNGQDQSLAFKIMRPGHIDYALPLFVEEIQILTMLGDVPGITPLVELGFLKTDEGQVLPSDESHASAGELSGQVIHYGVEQAQNYLAAMDRHLAAGWVPYIALVKRNAEHNLLRYCDLSFTHGWFLALRDSLLLSLQICDILQFAHDRNIIYRDHKILHYYWDVSMHGVTVIDWNIAKREPRGLTDEEKQFDLVQFAARGLHHIFAGRPAQGSLALGPNRPEDIEKASTHYPVNWTYDDERLPNQLRLILERALNQGYTQVRELRQDLLGIYQQLPGTENK